MAQALVRADRLCAWAGGSLLVTSLDGCLDERTPLGGYFFRETRFLNRCVFTLNGERPWLCEAAVIASDEIRFTSVWPEIPEFGGGGTGQSGDDTPRNRDGVPQRALEVCLTCEVSHGRLVLRATIVNRSRSLVDAVAAWDLDADFADIQEAQSASRRQTAPVARHATEREARFAYQHDRLPFETRVRATPALRAALSLEPRAQACLELSVTPIDPAAGAGDTAPARDAIVERWHASFVRIAAAGNRLFESVVNANIRDVGSMPLSDGPPEETLALQAGIPAYPAFFGRDAVTAGWQFAMIDRGDAADAALRKLARLQANAVDDWRDAQPGRVPQQVRLGPLAAVGTTPLGAYYGDYASPLMFVIGLANLFAWSGDRRQLDRHWDAARRILDWARDAGDLDGDGYLEYLTRSPDGPKHQGWKDSGDAIVYDDGSPVPAPIATCEIQGYWYAAQQLMALLCAARGEWRDARAWLSSASALKARFNRDWWCDADRCFALAMDPAKRLVAAPSSNVGHCLAAGIVDRDRIESVVGRLFAPDLFSGWGVRTLSSDHAFYDPLSYHRGSVWAVEQATIVFGLRRYGINGRVHQLAEALFDLAKLYRGYRIPECVGGRPRRDSATPGAYPRANPIQLWNASAFPLVVQSVLGIVPWAPQHLLVVDPVLPTWLPDLVVEGLRVGEARVSIRFTRNADGTSAFDVTEKHGPLRVVRQPPPESMSAGAADRIHALYESLIG